MSRAWQASEAELKAAGLAADLARTVVGARANVEPDRELDKVSAAGAHIITVASEAYPPLLREIPSPPALLYVRGNLTAQDVTRAVAVVGTREISAYGRQVTERLAADLAALGITIVSGLARGIDAVAHKAALGAGGRTVAVMGTGIDLVYPREHRRLAAEIEGSGALITEFPPGTEPAPERFPQRNRIISGLSLGTILTEAPARSGALITASFANHQGREVMAVPGDVLSVLSAGCNDLIRDGASLVRNADDVLETINFAAGAVQLPFELETAPLPQGDEQLIARSLSSRPMHLDEIARETKMSAQKVSAMLTIMEMKGIAKDVGGGNYVLARIHAVRR